MLRVRFVRYKNVVMAEILEQGEEIEREAFDISNNMYAIASEDNPSLCDNTLYIRGRNFSYDHLVGAYSYDSEKDAKEAISNFSDLIRRHNESLGTSKEEAYTEVIIAE